MSNEMKPEKASAKMLATLYEGEEKCRIECEEILPDFKDDINRLTAIDVKPKITSKKQYVQGNYFCVELDGTASFNVIYKSGEKSALTSSVFYEDFAHTIKVPLDNPGDYDTENAVVMLNLCCEPTGSRAISERKLSLKASISIGASIKCNRNISYYGNECGDIEKKLTDIKVTSLCAVADREFSFAEDIMLPPECLPCAEIIDCDAELICRNVKSADGKIVFNAEAEICCGYRAVSDSEEPEFISFSQPIEFSEVIESEAVSAGNMSEVLLTLSSLKAQSDIDARGDNRVIKLEIGYIATAVVYGEEEFSAVSDCFSVNREIKTNCRESRFEKLISLFCTESEIKTSFPTKGDNQISCECIKAKLDFKKAELEGESINLEGKLSLKFIALDKDGGTIYYDESLPVTVSVRPDASVDLTETEGLRLEAYGDVRDCELDINGSEIALKCSLLLHMRLYSKCGYEIAESIEFLSEKPVACKTSLIFCYPTESETLWDIAKLYCVPVERLIAENDISEGKLPPVIKIIA